MTNEFKEKLVEEGNNPSFGARPLRRAIVRLLEDTLAKNILRGDIKEDNTVTVGCNSKGEVVVS